MGPKNRCLCRFRVIIICYCRPLINTFVVIYHSFEATGFRQLRDVVCIMTFMTFNVRFKFCACRSRMLKMFCKLYYCNADIWIKVYYISSKTLNLAYSLEALTFSAMTKAAVTGWQVGNID